MRLVSGSSPTDAPEGIIVVALLTVDPERGRVPRLGHVQLFLLFTGKTWARCLYTVLTVLLQADAEMSRHDTARSVSEDPGHGRACESERCHCFPVRLVGNHCHWSRTWLGKPRFLLPVYRHGKQESAAVDNPGRPPSAEAPTALGAEGGR